MFIFGVDSGAHKVYEDIFKNYNKNLRPVKDPSTKTLVSVDSGLYSIDEVVSIKNIFRIPLRIEAIFHYGILHY